MLTPQDFVAKWRRADLSERSAVQQHFLDLCALVGHAPPVEYDPTGKVFAFEMGVDKTSGGQGWADVAKIGYFGWEYKGKHADLDKAYRQLLQYREALQNPPLLVVSNTEQVVIHTNFTNTPKQVVTLTLDDLVTPQGQRTLWAVFHNPDAFKPGQTTQQVTEEAAAEFSKLAGLLHRYGADPQQAAHFLIRLLFVLFAEDVGLLPDGLLRKLVENTRNRPAEFTKVLRLLFGAMATGGYFGADRIRHFNGGLFDNDTALDLDSESLNILARVDALDWASIEPTIFGTLFERGLDPSKRAQLGAHFTSKDDIVLIVEPVLMAPLRRRWAEVQAEARKLADRRDAAKGKHRDRLQAQLRSTLMDFAHELSRVRVLDPACGSGNFLYVALRLLLDLEKSVIDLADELGVGRFFHSVNVGQVMGIEINEYAYELAQTTIWIGYIQWFVQNGMGFPAEPILKPLHTIRRMDAILAFDAEGKPVEPEWPEATVICGNPPFLGGNKIRGELRDKYVEPLFDLYRGRVPASVDLCCYWFEKARAMVEIGRAQRVGLLATQAIRGGSNRAVLERIKTTGDIFWAKADREWVLDGAMVHVSMVAFDNGLEPTRALDGVRVASINANLSAAANTTQARRLMQNTGLCYRSDEKGGPFDIVETVARQMLAAPPNPHGRPNADVVRPYYNGRDVTQRWQRKWIIDFGVETSNTAAALYEQPYEYVRRVVKPVREQVRSAREREYWWLHRRPGPDMRSAIAGLSRFIATPSVSKHRLFVWLYAATIPDHQLYVFAREDDYFMGVLHSSTHEVWARKTGTQLREAESGFRYTPTSCFETFPLPWPPGHEPTDDPRLTAVAAAASELVTLRDAWLNPSGASEAELKKRTLTNLYNQRPTWLEHVHQKLDEAVFAAYGWPSALSNDDILARLLALNLERAAKQGEAVVESVGEAGNEDD
jgi:type II restriction/modification system DNA methylase subunit YeeA